jgi:hypothetical protein
MQSLITEVKSNATYRANPSALLDFTSTDGDTPLILATTRGFYQIVELLIQEGANIHQQNTRREGGTALHEAVNSGHDHVAELLLAAHASPFVENLKGFTPMDLACSFKNSSILRRMEDEALFSGWLWMKVPRMGGLGSEWSRRHVVICHRLPCPATQSGDRRTHLVLLAYKNTTSTSPACRAWMDGAKANEVRNDNARARVFGTGPAQLGVTLHPKHTAPSGAHCTGSNREGGFVLSFRPDEGSQAGVDQLKLFQEVINSRGATTGRRAQARAGNVAAGLRGERN